MQYRYPHFSRGLLKEDRTFASGPAPGERFPDLEVTTLDGGRVRTHELLDGRPALFTLASFT
jgi:hypothetical protein